jgi:urate oxidase
VETFAGPADKGVFSKSVQETLYLMACDALKKTIDVDNITLYMPNIHNIPFNLDTYGFKNQDHTGKPYIFFPIDEPHGMIRVRETNDLQSYKLFSNFFFHFFHLFRLLWRRMLVLVFR